MILVFMVKMKSRNITRVGFHPRTSTKWLINNHAAQIGRNISPEIFSISLGILVGKFPLPTSKQPRQGGLNIFRGCKESVHVPKPSPPAQGGLERFSVRFPSAPNHQVFCNKKKGLQIFRYSCWNMLDRFLVIYIIDIHNSDIQRSSSDIHIRISQFT